MNIIEKKYNWPRGIPGTRPSTGYIIIHHAAAKSCSADDVHRWHLDNGWLGIGYNFFVRKDGSIYRGRAEDAVGAHTVGYNSMSIGICFEGNFEVEQMPEAQFNAGHELIVYLRGKYPNAKMGKHKDFDSTACPGKYFPYDAIFTGKGINSTTTKTTTTEEGYDMTMTYLSYEDNHSAKSNTVKALQILLNGFDYNCGSADGYFGPNTEAAVIKFQKAKKLDADGIVGPKTWAALLCV